MKVRCHWNSRKKEWSITSKRSGRVIAYVSRVNLVDCKFSTSKDRRHYIDGLMAKPPALIPKGINAELSLNDDSSFIISDTSEAVTSAAMVILSPDRCVAAYVVN